MKQRKPSAERKVKEADDSYLAPRRRRRQDPVERAEYDAEGEPHMTVNQSGTDALLRSLDKSRSLLWHRSTCLHAHSGALRTGRAEALFVMHRYERILGV